MSLSRTCSRTTLSGLTSPSSQSLSLSAGREESAQLCVYVGEERVVDLWGSASTSYTPHTLSTVFSSTKSLTAIAMAALHDEGLLNYDAKYEDN